MKKYKVRAPAISMFWFIVKAEDKEAAWKQVAASLDNSKVNWMDEKVWEVQEVDDPIHPQEIKKRS